MKRCQRDRRSNTVRMTALRATVRSEAYSTMNHSPRRDLLRNLAALLALPLAASPWLLLGSAARKTSAATRPISRKATQAGSALRPRVSAPHGSVMRRV